MRPRQSNRTAFALTTRTFCLLGEGFLGLKEKVADLGGLYRIDFSYRKPAIR
jgi:hypothetical protein